jgi:hypothetical protein
MRCCGASEPPDRRGRRLIGDVFRRDESKIFRAAVTMIVVLGLQSFLTAVRILLGLLMRPPNP